MLGYWQRMGHPTFCKELRLNTVATLMQCCTGQQLWMRCLVNATVTCIKIGGCLFGTRSFTKSQWPLRLYATYWLCDVLIFSGYTICFELQQEHVTVNSLTDVLRYVLQTSTHLIVLLEALWKDQQRQSIERQLYRIEQRLHRNFAEFYDPARGTSISIVLGFVALLSTLVHTLLSWSVYPSTVLFTALYWHSLPSVLALQFKALEIIVALTRIEEMARLLRSNIDITGDHNLQCKCFGKFQQEQQNLRNNSRAMCAAVDLTEARLLRTYNQLYSDIYEAVQRLNDCYGWTLCAFMLMYFGYFIVNTYWIIFALITRPDNSGSMIIKNLGFLIIVVLLLCLLCWHSQECDDESREIGGLIFKLVKPLGNKRYNDLVTALSLQALHQPYVITAKNFFNLNLNLLGGMVVAIVTYLVILIQFMFAEKHRASGKLLSSFANQCLNNTN